MKHYIDSRLGSDEFRKQFRIIRDAFVTKLQRDAGIYGVKTFRACDLEGQPFEWVWDDAQFKRGHLTGTLSDARNFAAHMIDQGMKFAYMVADTSESKEMWLTTWEYPDEGPNWPDQHNPICQEIHEGVYRREEFQ